MVLTSIGHYSEDRNCCFYGGHEFEQSDHWQCYDCNRWFSTSIAHGCGGRAFDNIEQQKEKEIRYQVNMRNKQLRKDFKHRANFSTVKAQYNYRKY